MVSVYGLADPRNGELRYIGATEQSLEGRLSGHIGATKDASPRTKWVRELLRQGLRPEIFEIEVVDDSQGAEAERFYIQYFTYLGCKLTNVLIPYPPIDMEKVDKSLPQEILDLMVHRKRGRPRGLPCVVCGGPHYSTPRGTKLSLCKEHYYLGWVRARRDAAKVQDEEWA